VRTVVLLAGLLAAAAAAAQDAYRYVTPEGRVIYSDMPVPGARLDGTIAPPAPVSPTAAAGFTPSPAQEALLKSADERVRRLNELTVEIQNTERELRRRTRGSKRAEPPEGERIGTYAGGHGSPTRTGPGLQPVAVAESQARLNRAVRSGTRCALRSSGRGRARLGRSIVRQSIARRPRAAAGGRSRCGRPRSRALIGGAPCPTTSTPSTNVIV
jgi:hypothetical protein